MSLLQQCYALTCYTVMAMVSVVNWQPTCWRAYGSSRSACSKGRRLFSSREPGWTLAMPQAWWQHHKHCRGIIIIIIIIITPVFQVSVWGNPLRMLQQRFMHRIVTWWGYIRWWTHYGDMFSPFDTIQESSGMTDDVLLCNISYVRCIHKM